MQVLVCTKSQFKYAGILHWNLPAAFDWVPITFIQRASMICCFIFSILTTLGYVFVEAKQLSDASEPFIHGLTFFVFLMWYLLCVWKRSEFEQLFDDIQNLINTSNFEFI